MSYSQRGRPSNAFRYIRLVFVFCLPFSLLLLHLLVGVCARLYTNNVCVGSDDTVETLVANDLLDSVQTRLVHRFVICDSLGKERIHVRLSVCLFV